ncbi:hypothetical protein [Actinokineospora globicatena]|nr:hypothetical protein [Actinokineospora globicatena]
MPADVLLTTHYVRRDMLSAIGAEEKCGTGSGTSGEQEQRAHA